MTVRLFSPARPLALMLLSLALHGCGDATSESGPGGVSADDARQLDEAAAKLDAESQSAGTNDSKAAD